MRRLSLLSTVLVVISTAVIVPAAVASADAPAPVAGNEGTVVTPDSSIPKADGRAHTNIHIYVPPPGTKIPLPPRVKCDDPNHPSDDTCHFVK